MNQELTSIHDCDRYLQAHQETHLADMLALLRIPSISALPEHAADVHRAAEWLRERIARAGLEDVRVLPTGGHPAVFGQWLHAPGAPTVLIYGHFDVQPVDPLDLWDSPPFEPVVREGRVYARGASDNKGNLLAPILALEALLATRGALPVNVKLFLEGEEEVGSPTTPAFVASHGELLACDLVLNSDTGQHSEERPGLLVGLKGICALQIDLRGANIDLHSGIYGGAVQNPIHALVRLLDSMRSPEGRITVEGFYDDVAPLTAEERAQIAAVPHDDGTYKAALGVEALFGEPGYSTLERAWARPTLEVNGIWGGFQGAGSKTVIPAEAHAKLSCRLVPNQDPVRIQELVIRHLQTHLPPGVTAHVLRYDAQAKPYAVPADHWGNQAARTVLTKLYGVEPFYTRMGGSVPVTSLFLDHLGVYTIGLGFGLEDEKVHAPNEFYRLSSFRRGQRAYCLLLDELARAPRDGGGGR